MTLVAVASAVGCARRFVATTLRTWDRADLIDTAELLTSELVTNAIQATGVLAPDVKPYELTALNKLLVRIEESGGSVFVSVWDSDPAMPVAQSHSLEDEHGRGLLLVDAMSRRWSAYPSPSGGKVVWFELAPPLPPTAAGLPRRARAVCPVTPLDALCDRSTLLRVRDALLACT